METTRITECGRFIEKEIGLTHWIALLPANHYIPDGSTHIILTRDGYRYIKLLNSVCYVATDEDINGNAIWEKWHIRKLEIYPQPFDRNIILGFA